MLLWVVNHHKGKRYFCHILRMECAVAFEVSSYTYTEIQYIEFCLHIIDLYKS